MRSIDPRVDIAFKKIFGVEENKDLLISLVNSIVGKEDQVKEVTLLNPYNLKSFRNDKLSIVDIKATGEQGNTANDTISKSKSAMKPTMIKGRFITGQSSIRNNSRSDRITSFSLKQSGFTSSILHLFSMLSDTIMSFTFRKKKQSLCILKIWNFTPLN